MNNKFFKTNKFESFAVIGCGRFGENLALTLAKLGYQVLAVDTDDEKINRIAEYVDYAVQAEIGKEGALDQIGLSNVDCAIIGIGSDFEASIMATSICKDKNIPYIIAKAKSERHAQILLQIGADKVVLPEKDMGIRLAHSLAKRSVYEYIELSSEYSIVEMAVPSQWIGHKLESLNLRTKYGVNIIGIINTGYSNINPMSSDTFREGDHIFVLGDEKSILEIEKMKGVQ